MKLVSDSPIPLYYQLEEIIKERIKNGEYLVDSQIPSERSLSTEFDVSRMTVSKAINNLVEDDVLYRKRGLGTFVSKAKIEFFPGLLGFTELITNKGMKASSSVLSQEVILADGKLCGKLGINEGEKVILTQRLRRANLEIINLEKSYVPFNIGSKLLEADLSKESIYKLLSDVGFAPNKAYQEVNAILSYEELNKLLETEDGCAILKRTRTTYSNDRIVEYSVNYYKGDKYSLVMTVQD